MGYLTADRRDNRGEPMKRRNRISSIRKAALRKLRSRAGESISETMVSVLIAALSLVMLAGAVTSASNSIAKSKEKLNAYYDVNEMLVQKSVSNSGNTPTAVKYDELTFDEALAKHLKVMDQTAYSLCREGNMPIIVFDMNGPGNLRRILDGEKIGTLVHV